MDHDTTKGKSNPDQEVAHKEMITDKLLEFQRRVSAISKDSVNPFFKSKYFDVNTVIDTIKPILNEVGLVVTQPIGIEDGRNVLFTNIMDNGQTLIFSRIYLPEVADVQKFGAAITYFRRYALVSLLLLQGEEDDDGNKVQSKPAKPLKSQNFASNKPVGVIPIDINEIVPDKNQLTRKQGLFIKSLRTEKGLEQISDDELRKMGSAEASAEIKRLQELTDDVIQIEGPYVPGHEND